MPGMERADSQCFSLAEEKDHRCSRFCEFSHVCGNVWACRTSGATHICDSTCDQRVQLDSYQSVCRLSKRTFTTQQRCDAQTVRPFEITRKAPQSQLSRLEPVALQMRGFLTVFPLMLRRALRDQHRCNTAAQSTQPCNA